mmetsp:Transcript_13374/g.38780  ORF Transcript_13374/g.38780 Transcript_13374/m.38780 type:complete len:255 (-) Transcript_13374:155-919(-)
MRLLAGAPHERGMPVLNAFLSLRRVCRPLILHRQRRGPQRSGRTLVTETTGGRQRRAVHGSVIGPRALEREQASHLGQRRLVTRKGDVEFRVIRQLERHPNGLCKLTVPIRARLDLKAIRLAVEVDIHDGRGRYGLGSLWPGQSMLPVGQHRVTELAVGLFTRPSTLQLPASETRFVCHARAATRMHELPAQVQTDPTHGTVIRGERVERTHPRHRRGPPRIGQDRRRTLVLARYAFHSFHSMRLFNTETMRVM